MHHYDSEGRGALPRPLYCWALTPQGADVARAVASHLGAYSCVPERMTVPGERGFSRLADGVAEVWPLSGGHIFVAAAGIVVRCVAPLLTHKTHDPAVVVCDQEGRFAVSLLSGHLGHANELAFAVAEILGAQPVITTATDSAGLPAFDMMAAKADCAFADIREVRAVSAALLDGKTVIVRDPLGVLDAQSILACPQCRLLGSEISTKEAAVSDSAVDNAEVGGRVVVSLASLSPSPGLLRLHPRRVQVGVGCRKGVPGTVIEQAIRASLALADISPLSVAGLASADVKADELGLHGAAQAFNVPLVFFSPEALAALDVPHPSAKAAEVLGVERAGVCESAALLAAGPGSALLLAKQVFDVKGRRCDGGTGGLVTVALASGREPSRHDEPPNEQASDKQVT